MFNGTQGTKDLRFKTSSQEAVSYRLSDDLEDAKMITGISQRVTADFQEAQEGMHKGERDYEESTLVTNVRE